MKIRKAVEADADTLAKHNVLMAQETENISLDINRTLTGIKSVLCDLSKGFYLIAEENGTVIGQLMITYEWSDWRNENIWWIQSVYVTEGFRNKHVFKQLLQEIYRLGKAKGVKIFRLYVYRKNRQAITVYDRVMMRQKEYLIFEKAF